MYTYIRRYPYHMLLLFTAYHHMVIRYCSAQIGINILQQLQASDLARKRDGFCVSIKNLLSCLHEVKPSPAPSRFHYFFQLFLNY